MSASEHGPDRDYPWLQEHLRDMAFDETEMKVQQQMVDQGQVFPHDIENPAGCWVELVHACRIQDPNARKQHVLKWNALARCSRWNREMLLALRDDSDSEPDVEYGGPFHNSEEEMEHHIAVKSLLDAADAEANKEIAGGLPATPPNDGDGSEPMTEPYMDE